MPTWFGSTSKRIRTYEREFIGMGLSAKTGTVRGTIVLKRIHMTEFAHYVGPSCHMIFNFSPRSSTAQPARWRQLASRLRTVALWLLSSNGPPAIFREMVIS